MQALRSAQDGAHGLEGNPNDVVVGLLRGQGAAAGLGVKPKGLGTRVRDAVALLHQGGPELPSGAEFRDLLKKIGEDGEEEGEPRRKFLHPQAGCPGRLHIGDRMGERESELLGGRGAGLAQVVSGDGDGVPVGEPLSTVGEEVRG